jgi:hypothetical protein
MDDEVARERLTEWWDTLTTDDQAALIGLDEGDVLPGRYVAGLTKALQVGPVGAKWVDVGGGDVTFYVDERVGRFLESRRELA